MEKRPIMLNDNGIENALVEGRELKGSAPGGRRSNLMRAMLARRGQMDADTIRSIGAILYPAPGGRDATDHEIGLCEVALRKLDANDMKLYDTAIGMLTAERRG